ncbi:hypothetical protein [Burkholderia ubonensis]|uniref:hypothetical protein n=1 Tax=Burkholderia ubonensis TaxID=101571 RepID=UPI0007565C22|nr:hypothetical protein [Burkholderia ubonensis]KVS44233.1 hypothetical protein WK37_15515 [Burkholderia ubonensis]KVS46871.1 hypothetical protein WK38_02605 [Burkholderia ubonensis]KVS79966.1 hypothetical protein WK44_32190 [Burkholderia ubonensis]KVS82928.1 hypothetical protein WK42_10225 [Burkholderia ubonensis]KVS87334.1 hypothetical protein WK43_19855 [Burkholderia ubonensis]
MRDRDEPIKVRRRRTSRAREPRLAGQRDIRPEIFSEERASTRASGRKNLQCFEWKGDFLFDVEAAAFSVDSDIRKF